MKRKITLNTDEMGLCSDIHKEIIESFGRRLTLVNEDKAFQMFSLTIAITISNMLTTLGIKKVNPYLNDLNTIIEIIHKNVKKNSDYMLYENGEKLSEGKFN